MNGDEVTTGEIFRRLCDMDERYEKKLDRIEQQVRTTNGRTTTLEANFENLKSEVRSMKGPVTPPSLPSFPVTTNDGESITVKVSNKVWTGICAAVAVASPILVEKLKDWFGK